MLILAAAAQNLCLWSCLVCSAAPYLTSLCLSLCEPFTSLLLLSFPPRPRRPWVYSLEVALWGGWGGGVYMVGATLWCPHHWLLWIWRVRRYKCVTRNIVHEHFTLFKKDKKGCCSTSRTSRLTGDVAECGADAWMFSTKSAFCYFDCTGPLDCIKLPLKKSYRGRIPQQNTAIKVFIKQKQT